MLATIYRRTSLLHAPILTNRANPAIRAKYPADAYSTIDRHAQVWPDRDSRGRSRGTPFPSTIALHTSVTQNTHLPCSSKPQTVIGACCGKVRSGPKGFFAATAKVSRRQLPRSGFIRSMGPPLCDLLAHAGRHARSLGGLAELVRSALNERCSFSASPRARRQEPERRRAQQSRVRRRTHRSPRECPSAAPPVARARSSARGDGRAGEPRRRAARTRSARA